MLKNKKMIECVEIKEQEKRHDKKKFKRSSAPKSFPSFKKKQHYGNQLCLKRCLRAKGQHTSVYKPMKFSQAKGEKQR